MIYIIKFLYSFVLPPGLFILIMAGLVVWLWRHARKPAVVLLMVTLLLYASSTNWVGDLLISSLEKQYPQPRTIQGDVIVVLGGGATEGTPDINGQGNLLGSAANRLLTAARLHEATGLPILFSGGQVFGDSGNEANIAQRQLLGLGIPAQDILIENRSLNTQQNAAFTSQILKQHQLTNPILVTSAFHMPRAALEFQRAGMQVTPYPTDYLASLNVSLYAAKLTPSAGAMSTTGTALKEYLGILALKLK
ncbi:YdcF family protein [Paenibacillus peoriae]|uniref:YdcF family protein n=1 Tax=Paenibacillus peoriae TaxID=59893 RepID=UPI00026C5B75|nr:YdcF family protein [Paenibacillus peoriae]MEC0183195.1 YdcF family protein [Paenibacillus peoriae]